MRRCPPVLGYRISKVLGNLRGLRPRRTAPRLRGPHHHRAAKTSAARRPVRLGCADNCADYGPGGPHHDCADRTTIARTAPRLRGPHHDCADRTTIARTSPRLRGPLRLLRGDVIFSDVGFRFETCGRVAPSSRLEVSRDMSPSCGTSRSVAR